MRPRDSEFSSTVDRQVGEQHGQWLESPEHVCGMETSELESSEQEWR